MNVTDRTVAPLDYAPAPESDADARAWIAARGPDMRLFVGGEWRLPASGAWFDTHYPATGEVLGRIAQADAADVDAAVAAARAAQPAWAALGGHGRARYLYAIARHVQKHHRLLAVLETLDNGKPIRETRDIDVPLVARHFYHHAGWAQLFETEFASAGYGPHGVCGQIIPWNFPLLMLSWKIAPALAAGNTVVLKPAEFTSLTALLFAEICQDVGLPPGVVNIITGDGRTGEAIVGHPDIDKLAFTGSTDVGRIIRRATAGTTKALTLELGGKSPFVVFADTDLDSSVEGVVDAIWFNQGQVCCAGSRLLVQERVADEVYRKLRERMERLRVGSPLDKAVDIGAIIAPVQLERIRSLCAQGVAEGATCWQPSWAVPADGWYYPPTLFTDVEPAGTIAQVEIFGPVLVAMTFRTPDEAVELANNTPFGLAASVWTENVNVALDVAQRIKAGTVWINGTNQFDAASGFGGYRESGFGREGGREGMWAYVRATGVRSGSPAAGSLPQTLGRGSGGEGLRPSGIEAPPDQPMSNALPPLDRTPKHYIAARQTRPDGGNSRPVLTADGRLAGHVADGNRKDIRNAVEAAHKGLGAWRALGGPGRAQVLYFVAENMEARRAEFAARIADLTGAGEAAACAEVDDAVRGWCTWAAWADKHDGAVHSVPQRALVLAVHEPFGVAGVIAPDARPLAALTALVGPLLAAGNAVVAVPSERWPLPATDLYQVFDTSDVPAGAVNLVTGARAVLAPVLADHDDVALLWYAVNGGHGDAADAALGADIEARSAGNVKRTWRTGAWAGDDMSDAHALMRQASQVKNIWVPYGA
ncbi:MAG: aldehyde dehydrogenase family protein [Ardenticatenales bacterium]|nr:aldehyde dehydrogenase family protein [Ardenticatenales bacterium]